MSRRGPFVHFTQLLVLGVCDKYAYLTGLCSLSCDKTQTNNEISKASRFFIACKMGFFHDFSRIFPQIICSKTSHGVKPLGSRSGSMFCIIRRQKSLIK